MTETSEKIELLAKALVDAQGEFGTVAKTAENPFFKSKYADLPAVVNAASSILHDKGLAVTQLLGYEGDNDTLTTRLIHESGQWIESTMRLHPVKPDPQSHGSAITYARRYSYMAILGLVADEDDDGNAASGSTPRQAHKQTGPRTQTPPAEDDTAPNLRRLFAIMKGNKTIPTEDAGRHEWASGVLGKIITTFKDLSAEDVSLLEKSAKAPSTQESRTYADDDPERPFD